MKKFAFCSVIALSLATSTALAQTYYQAPSACASVVSGLSFGSRGASVTGLQNFLVAQNYPGGGGWMVTGYFGEATQAAVRNFQSLHGLAQTGSVDAATASAMNASCGGSGAYGAGYSGTGYDYQYPNYYQPIATTYPSNYSYPSYLSYYGGAPAVLSLSQNTGMPGQSVTVYGVGFDAYNNTVNFDGTALYNIPSNGNSLTFTIPSTVYGYADSFSGTPVNLSVQNSRGTSNTLTFTIYGGYGGCGYGYNYGYNNCGGCGNQYPYNYNYYNCAPPYQQTTNATISYINPASGGVGTSVTIYGSGFTSNNNTVHFGPGIITNLLSSDGRSLSFTVPSSISGYGTQPLTLSTYQISVTNGVGITSNAVSFTVTSLSGYGSGQPAITSVTGPNTLAAGQQGTWSFVISAPVNQYLSVQVSWGDQGYFGAQPVAQTQYSANQTVSLTHTYYQAGTYQIVFTVSNGSQSNTYTTSVSVGGSGYYGSNAVSIQNLAFNPQSITVHAGTTVVWTNNDSMQHTVTSDAGLFNSGTLNPGQTFSYTFTQTGTFTYHCVIHPGMTGTIAVTP